MEEKKTGLAEMLRGYDDSSSLGSCPLEQLVGVIGIDWYATGGVFACGECYGTIFGAIADMVDAEVAAAREASAREGMAVIAAAEGWPALRDGESVVEWADRAWLPRPRYEGGDPVEVGGRAAGLAGRVGSYQVSDSGGWVLFGLDDYDIVMGSRDTPVRRLPEDTQADIDAEASLPPAVYCAQRGIDLGDDPDRETATAAMVRDLLRRQRELDERMGGAE